MKAVRIESFGQPASVVHAVDLPDPEPPGQGEALLAVEASPINPADIAVLAGTYGHLPELPAIPGSEGVGRVLSLGPGATGVAVGDRVLLPLGSGTWREKLKAPAASLIPIPPSADPLQLAMTMVNPPTAYLLLKQFVELEPGAWVIQNAANSAVGKYLIQFAKVQGVKTINVVRRPELKESLLALGADAVVVDGPDLKAHVAKATGDAKIPLAIDAIAGASAGHLAECLADGGTLVNYGAMSGEPLQLGVGPLVFHDIHVRGFWLGAWFRSVSRDASRELLQQVIAQLASGAVKAEVEATYPFERIQDAVKHAGEGGRGGKILLVGSSGGRVAAV
jgi:mitochondrial enoyl-[acyl-carrier protein] reductase / trans-2-enoyl-CoA reductase